MPSSSFAGKFNEDDLTEFWPASDRQPLAAPDWPALSKRWAAFQSALNELRERSTRRAWGFEQSDTDLRHYVVPVFKAFQAASSEYPAISVDSQVMGGAPCLADTRIPVYMVLDALEHYGDFAAAMRSYPTLTLEQIKDAVGFAKLVVECPVDERSPSIT
jgi:uncharacterized protein (DUF433 family)